ncbi:MAG: hypothetical protein A4S17_01260 [Proteobacteria bacterium HN_bin10]|nr:MAG: hypothetical protein A4S17_01260 [Proteobacteria bacterium HN_bin10]
MPTLRALLFDFDGVIADSEPVHYAALRQVLAEIGIDLTEADYYEHYLGFDDKGCFTAALTAQGRPLSPSIIDDLVRRKAALFLTHIRQHLVIFPGVREMVRAAAGRFRLAIVSGALRHEIELILEQAGIRKEFEHITSSEDIRRGKPDPEGFLHALAALNRSAHSEASPLAAGDCLVIEDSIPGIRAARAAGMKVLAVANTHSLQNLGEADALATTLVGTDLDELRQRLWGAG